MMVPEWAQELTRRACDFVGKSPPTIDWSQRVFSSSSGMCYPARHLIKMHAGLSQQNAKMILLHELAHDFTGDYRHTPSFWDMAWKLYKWSGLPLRYCLHNESRYKAGAVYAYTRMTGRPAKPHIIKKHHHKWLQVLRDPDKDLTGFHCGCGRNKLKTGTGAWRTSNRSLEVMIARKETEYDRY